MISGSDVLKMMYSCMCALADIIHPLLVENTLLIGLTSQHDAFDNSRNTEKGHALAHVQMPPTSSYITKKKLSAGDSNGE